MSKKNNPNEVPEVPTTKEQQIIDKVRKGGRKSPHEELMGTDSKDDSNNNTDSNNDNKNSILDELQNNQKSKKQTHTFKGYYLENKVAQNLDAATFKGGKGIKSELVNALIKKYLKEEGLWNDNL